MYCVVEKHTGTPWEAEVLSIDHNIKVNINKAHQNIQKLCLQGLKVLCMQIWV